MLANTVGKKEPFLLGHVGSVTMNDDSSVLRKKKTLLILGQKRLGYRDYFQLF